MMGKMDVQVKGLDAVVNSLQRMASSITPELVSTLESSATEAEDIMKQNIPSQSGSLAASIGHEVILEGTTVSAHIGPNDSEFEGRPVGSATEMGRRPGGGFPNWHDIASRYGVSLGVGYLIAKKIQQDGSRGIFYAQKTVETVKGVFFERGLSAMRNLITRR